MKSVIKMGTHMIVSGACMLVVAPAFDNVWELLAYSLVTMLLGLACHMLRMKEMSFWMFSGSHLFMLVGGIVTIQMADLRVWYSVIWVGLVLYSAILRLVPTAAWLEEPGYAYVTFLVCIYLFVCFSEGTPTVQKISLCTIFILFLFYLLYRNLDTMDEFIVLQGFSTEVDEKGIRDMNTQLSLVYTGVLGAVLCLFGLFQMEGLWQKIVGWLKMAVRYLLSFLPMTEQAPQEEKPEIQEDMSNLVQGIPEDQEPSAFMQILGEVFRIAFTILIVVAIIAGIIYVARYIYRHFHHKQQVHASDKIVESLTVGERVLKERKIRQYDKGEQNSSKKIRKLYKKNMKRLGAKRIAGFSYMSPEEQVKLLRDKGLDEDTVREIKCLYEKARYSSERVEDAEVNYMRKNM